MVGNNAGIPVTGIGVNREACSGGRCPQLATEIEYIGVEPVCLLKSRSLRRLRGVWLLPCPITDAMVDEAVKMLARTEGILLGLGSREPSDWNL